jgi:hypothetical protein
MVLTTAKGRITCIDKNHPTSILHIVALVQKNRSPATTIDAGKEANLLRIHRSFLLHNTDIQAFENSNLFLTTL